MRGKLEVQQDMHLAHSLMQLHHITTPSHPDTVVTTVTYCEHYMQQRGMKFFSITANMQLFKVATQIKWSNQERWQNIVLRPGGIDIIMSFTGCIGVLMKGTGLEEIIKSAFNSAWLLLLSLNSALWQGKQE